MRLVAARVGHTAVGTVAARLRTGAPITAVAVAAGTVDGTGAVPDFRVAAVEVVAAADTGMAHPAAWRVDDTTVVAPAAAA
jgi:hypothetical protein